MDWVLDVACREDQSRTRDLNAGGNLAWLRRVAVSLLKRVKAKGSINTRRLVAAWDDQFLLQILQETATNHSAYDLRDHPTATAYRLFAGKLHEPPR